MLFLGMKCDNAKIIVLGGVNVLKSRVILASAAVMHSDVNSNTKKLTLSNYLCILLTYQEDQEAYFYPTPKTFKKDKGPFVVPENRYLERKCVKMDKLIKLCYRLQKSAKL